MEKGKVHVKSEQRGVSTQSQQQATPKLAEGHLAASLSPDSKSSPYMGTHHNLDHSLQSAYYHPQRPSSKTNPANISECDTLGNSANDGVFPLCYVCGGNGGCESLRIRPNQECPTEPYFPFLERHEPPNGVPKVANSQTYVIACMLCYRSLREQWDAYERKKKPHLQRLYHMKRVDGKNYIGADIQTQGEYAAQVLGLSADHLQHGTLHEDFAYFGNVQRTPNRAEYERPANVVNQYFPVHSNEPPSSLHYAQTTNVPSSSSAQQYCDYYNRNVNATLNGQLTPQPKEKQISSTQLPKGMTHMNEEPSTVETRKAVASGSPYESINIKSSSFAHHKFKLGQISYMNSAAARHDLNPPNEAQKPTSNLTSDSKQHQIQHQRQDRISPYDYGIAAGGGSHSNAPSMADADDTGAALDLRNSNNICEPYMLSCGTSRQMFRNASPSNTANQVDVGILDLSMPDKNSLTEVCYVCGDEQRRGSLIELSTVRSKDLKGRHHPYFPIFNEQHPRPPRSRPKDPRGMIQACQLCFENLIQQWNSYQTGQTPENDRSYTLRKKPTSVTERTTFVCYTCGGDTPSSRLRLVYCCPNAEREPYYPFIKTMKAFKNASPISPQGMVQICSSCYEKHLYLAEGGNNATMATATSTGRVSVGAGCDNSAGVGGAGVIYSIDSDSNLNNNNVIGTSAEGAGRYTPSEKSLANSDSTSNVKFKPYEPISNSSPSTQRDFKFARQGDSRPNSPTSSSQGPGENERGQYPCSICKVLSAANKMEWLSTSAEHMNSHAMHFPCLRGSNSNSRDNVSLSGNNGGGGNGSGGSANNNDTNNRVLACKDCVNYLARQWETMDAERVPLEHRRYNIPSPMITSSSPNGSRHGGLTITTPPSTPSVSSTPASTSIYCFLCGLHSDLTLARVLYASKEVKFNCNFVFVRKFGLVIIRHSRELDVFECLPTISLPFQPYEPISNSSPSTQRDFKFARQGDSRPNSPTSSSQGPGENERGQYPCSICKVLSAANKMEWLSTSAEHMNSHAMHFPCLRGSNSNSRDNVSLSGNNGGGGNGSGGSANNNDTNNRVLACKDCVNYLARQWETMDAERVPLEHRRYNIPSPMITSSSPNGSRHGGLTITTPPSTPSVSSTPASTSIYCFLCGLHSDLTLARVLYASKEGSRPYFPHLLKHNSLPNAEQLRKDYSALVCTFCYHSMLNQWRKYEAQTPAIAPTERKYNWHDYICHLCGITTYRKRVRALPVNEFPFVKNRKNGDGLLLENGEYAVRLLGLLESLRQQASHHDRFGVPISRRGYNWVPQPPPPEDSPDVAVARLPCGERSDRF
ncbi:PREDICTED: uncharacterized protein LOC108367696, partial [Rhagoletis zephyria]|uniref:uncharacterized protein LOC108367696 n=1 Tax=Rhagoletis zephyria TaxID=28612 RepID=UPI000811A772